jgi:hypothetical protein
MIKFFDFSPQQPIYIIRYIVVVKKTFRYSNVFFYNRTRAYAPIPYFGTLLRKAV